MASITGTVMWLKLLNHEQKTSRFLTMILKQQHVSVCCFHSVVFAAVFSYVRCSSFVVNPRCEPRACVSR